MATYRIEWKASALRELKRLDREVIPRIVRAVEERARDPIRAGTRKLQGTEHLYRVRVGDFRVIYEVAQDRLAVCIVRVRHRSDAYRG